VSLTLLKIKLKKKCKNQKKKITRNFFKKKNIKWIGWPLHFGLWGGRNHPHIAIWGWLSRPYRPKWGWSATTKGRATPFFFFFFFLIKKGKEKLFFLVFFFFNKIYNMYQVLIDLTWNSINFLGSRLTDVLFRYTPISEVSPMIEIKTDEEKNKVVKI